MRRKKRSSCRASPWDSGESKVAGVCWRGVHTRTGHIGVPGSGQHTMAGDQTDNDWKYKPATEEKLVAAGAIPDGPEIDVLKANHHGSDTSSGSAFVHALDPEVAVISAEFTSNYRLPKRITLRQFQKNRCYVLITGDGLDPETDDFPGSAETNLDDPGAFTVDPDAVFNNRGDAAILVLQDGDRYTVIGDSFGQTFSAMDAQNQR